MSDDPPRKTLSPALRAFIVVDAVLLLLLLAFFMMSQLGGGDPGPDAGQAPSGSPTPSVVTSPTAPAGAAAPTPTPSPTESVLRIPTPTPPGDPLAETGGQVFALPSRNITCAIGAEYVTCVIAGISAEPQSATGCSGGVTGYAARVTADGQVTMPCTAGAPDRAPNEATTLAYGDRLTVNGFTCTSDNSGVTCSNDEAGTGFTMARRGIETF